MERRHILVSCGCALFVHVALANECWAQAFVNQATPSAGGSVYVDQVPAGATPRAPKSTAIRSTPRRQVATTKASTLQEVAIVRLVPTVGAGSSAIIKSSSSDEWPSVGSGTIRN